MPVVATNTAANTATRFLNNNSSMAAGSVGKLASGSRIVKASDDAAGLAIASRLNSDIVALQQSAVNASQGSSMVQVADGGLARIGDVLQRMKALAAASLSGVPTNDERAFIDAEFQQLRQEIDGIANTTSFNGASLLNGQGTTQASFFVGTNAGDNIEVTFAALATGITNFTVAGTDGLDVTSSVTNVANATSAMGEVDAAIDIISEARANAGALMSRFEFRGQQIATSVENIQAAESAISDVDLAAEQAKLVSSQVLVQASVSALSQANQIPQSLLRVLQ
ncbi:flagellin [Denitrobaculum tricleocarpae]|uniref:Flagellin n=1 Tax=Denitrobaculum tricleocarpae TaxID=2591009 RepID=A0A545T255_9PROT|nr:flagellin [Denitrobaculum tricleocarpae]TQV71318.1 flagellin [Denitrobaculum tricleocarpae]